MTVDLNGIKNYTADENGTIKVPIKELKAGTHTATITYKENEYYTGSEKSVEITIEKTNSTLNISPVELDYGDSINLTATTSGATGIIAEIDGKTIAVTGNIILISGLNVGTHNLTVTTIPDENHTETNKTVSITVNKTETQITANPISTTYGIDKDLIVTLMGNDKPISGANQTVDLNGAKTYVTDGNGQIKIAVGRLVPNTYNVKITFNGDGNYVNSTKEVKATVEKAKTNVITKAKKYKKSLKIKKYGVILKANNGKAVKKVKVYLKVNGKIYVAKTNNNGKAMFKITKLTKKGTFKARITFKGNNYYGKINKMVKIKIV